MYDWPISVKCENDYWIKRPSDPWWEHYDRCETRKIIWDTIDEWDGWRFLEHKEAFESKPLREIAKKPALKMKFVQKQDKELDRDEWFALMTAQ